MENDKIAAFDTLYTSNHIQIMKLALPLMPPDKQYFGAIFIKYMELHYTIQLGKYLKNPLYACSGPDSYGMEHFLKEIVPFCTEKEAEKINKISGMIKSFKTFQEIKSMLDIFGTDLSGAANLFGGLDSGGIGADFSPDMLKGLLSDEQMALFEMFMDGGSPNEKQ